MATLDEREMLIGKAVMDTSFRDWLFSDPAGAADSLGIELTEGEIGRIEAIGPDGAQQLAACIHAVIPGGQPGRMLNYWQSA